MDSSARLWHGLSVADLNLSVCERRALRLYITNIDRLMLYYFRRWVSTICESWTGLRLQPETDDDVDAVDPHVSVLDAGHFVFIDSGDSDTLSIDSDVSANSCFPSV